MKTHQLHSIKKVPFIVYPEIDESISSWLIRLSRKHYSDLKDFLDHNEFPHLLKFDLDNTSDVSDLLFLFETRIKLPINLKTKIESFKWKPKMSNWIIQPNKNGGAIYNSYTQICTKCVEKKHYAQLKWKLNLFIGCIECEEYYLKTCPKCKSFISPLKADLNFKTRKNLNPFFNCFNCHYDFRKSKSERMSSIDLESQRKIHKAYNEDPVNHRYLYFLQYGKILGINIDYIKC